MAGPARLPTRRVAGQLALALSFGARLSLTEFDTGWPTRWWPSPSTPFAQSAEAAGCGAALGLLLAHAGPGPRRAAISGDNLAVIRFGAGVGRLARPDMFLRLCHLQAALLCRGWTLTWRAVRRRLNQAADELATIGVTWAGQLPVNDADVARSTHWPAAFVDDPEALAAGHAADDDPSSGASGDESPA